MTPNPTQKRPTLTLHAGGGGDIPPGFDRELAAFQRMSMAEKCAAILLARRRAAQVPPGPPRHELRVLPVVDLSDWRRAAP